MNEFLIIANLKGNLLPRYIAPYLKEIESCDSNLVICPSSIYVPYFLKHNYSVGLQNIYCDGNLYTGEISPNQAYGLGVKYVILGHSDRRTKFNENDYDINKTMLECLKCGLKVILCIGETLEEKSMLKTARVIKKQLTLGLRNINNLDNVFIAYEPVWAIGVSVVVVSPQYAEKSHEIIRNCLAELYGRDRADSIPIIYGGSVDKENALPLIEQQQIDGLGIGRNAWDAEGFNRIIRKVIFEQKRGKSDAENIE